MKSSPILAPSHSSFKWILSKMYKNLCPFHCRSSKNSHIDADFSLCSLRSVRLSQIQLRLRRAVSLWSFSSLMSLLLLPPAFAASDLAPNAHDTAKVEEVKQGTRTKANAAWWGFNPDDSTDTIQAAINSGARTVVISNVGAPWIVRPITLRSNLELIFNPGVLVLAKQGEFQGGGDALFRATDMTDITIRGHGATLRMRKKDYQNPPYTKAEWRMGLAFTGCKRVLVEGVRVESSGGDGIYIGSSGQLGWCEDVVIRDCISHDNHRQGISIISAVNLLIENSVFSGTSGTPPEAGIDFEPDSPHERLINCVVRNCLFENNQGHEILVYLKPLDQTSEPVSIRFENCHSRMGLPGMKPEDFTDMDEKGWSGMSVGAAHDKTRGLVEFINCTSENTGREGTKIYDKSAIGAKVRFVNCTWTNPWVSAAREYAGPRVPVLILLRRPEITERLGGIEFVDCHVFDNVFRPAVQLEEIKSYFGLHDVSGRIFVQNPTGVSARLGQSPQNVSLEVVEIGKRDPTPAEVPVQVTPETP
jgi:hypothetical protein